MIAYVLNLKRSVNRFNFITNHLEQRNINFKIVEAVDGNDLTQSDIEKNCDVERINKSKHWLSKGAIGCALSHYKAYQEFLETSEKCALILEDDVVLPVNFDKILSEIENVISEDEIILLVYSSFVPTQLSLFNAVKLSEGMLCYPMEIRKILTASSYIIGKETARKMADNIIPVSVTADFWHHYYNKNCFSTLRVHYPSVIAFKNYKSTIDYIPQDSVKEKISKMIDTFKIPVIYQILKIKRERNFNKRIKHFSLTDKVSPVDLNKSSIN